MRLSIIKIGIDYLTKIESNEILAGYHLAQLRNYYEKASWCEDFGGLVDFVAWCCTWSKRRSEWAGPMPVGWLGRVSEFTLTEQGYAVNRSQIKQAITALQQIFVQQSSHVFLLERVFIITVNLPPRSLLILSHLKNKKKKNRSLYHSVQSDYSSFYGRFATIRNYCAFSTCHSTGILW